MLVWEPALQKVLPFGTLKTWADRKPSFDIEISYYGQRLHHFAAKKVNSDPWQPRPVCKLSAIISPERARAHTV